MCFNDNAGLVGLPARLCVHFVYMNELCAEVTADVCCVCVHVFGHSDLHQAQSNKLQL